MPHGRLPNVPLLIVEDHPASARLIAALLATGGASDVRIAYSAEEALDLVHVSPVRVLIVDVLLPGMSGLDLVRHLKADPALQGTASIAVSVIGGDDAERQAMESGCVGFIEKPLDPDAFLQALTSVVRDVVR